MTYQSTIKKTKRLIKRHLTEEIVRTDALADDVDFEAVMDEQNKTVEYLYGFFQPAAIASDEWLDAMRREFGNEEFFFDYINEPWDEIYRDIHDLSSE